MELFRKKCDFKINENELKKEIEKNYLDKILVEEDNETILDELYKKFKHDNLTIIDETFDNNTLKTENLENKNNPLGKSEYYSVDYIISMGGSIELLKYRPSTYNFGTAHGKEYELLSNNSDNSEHKKIKIRFLGKDSDELKKDKCNFMEEFIGNIGNINNDISDYNENLKKAIKTLMNIVKKRLIEFNNIKESL